MVLKCWIRCPLPWEPIYRLRKRLRFGQLRVNKVMVNAVCFLTIITLTNYVTICGQLHRSGSDVTHFFTAMVKGSPHLVNQRVKQWVVYRFIQPHYSERSFICNLFKFRQLKVVVGTNLVVLRSFVSEISSQMIAITLACLYVQRSLDSLTKT